MPLTVRKFNAQVRDQTTGNMIPAGLLSSDALGAIEDAKQDAIDAVEAKGIETINSIPDNYTALSDEVDDLKTQIYEPVEITGWTKGVIKGNGTIDTSTNGVMAPNMKYSIDMPATIFGDCQAVLAFYTENGTYIGKVGADGSVNQTAGDWMYFTSDVYVKKQKFRFLNMLHQTQR